MAKQKTKEPEIKQEPKKTTYEDLLASKTFSIPAIINDNRQENNAIVSEDELRKIMFKSRIRDEIKNSYKRVFQYF